MSNPDNLPTIPVNWKDRSRGIARARIGLSMGSMTPWHDLFVGEEGRYAVFVAGEEVTFTDVNKAVVALRRGLGDRALRVGVVLGSLGVLTDQETTAAYPAAAVRLTNEPLAVRIGMLRPGKLAGHSNTLAHVEWLPTMGVYASDGHIDLSEESLEGVTAEQVRVLGVPVIE